MTRTKGRMGPLRRGVPTCQVVADLGCARRPLGSGVLARSLGRRDPHERPSRCGGDVSPGITRSQDHWRDGRRITGSHDHKITGPMVVDHKSRSQKKTNRWTERRRITGSQDHWITGRMVAGSRDHSITGSLARWSQYHGITGSQDHWTDGRWITRVDHT